jgi:hypothetical protein
MHQHEAKCLGLTCHDLLRFEKGFASTIDLAQSNGTMYSSTHKLMDHLAEHVRHV